MKRPAIPTPDGDPPVSTLLAALVWLASRQRTEPDRRNLLAMVQQLRRLAVHPQASYDDLQAGLRLAASVELEMIQWLGTCADPDRTSSLALHKKILVM